jgi:hypothetical protein
MTHSERNDRWINNPERRVGQTQLLRARLAGMDQLDPLYQEYSERLAMTGARNTNGTDHRPHR